MGRKKQSNPQRSGGLVIASNGSTEPVLGKQKAAARKVHKKKEEEDDAPYFVQVDTSCLISNEHLDISEVVLTDLKFREGFTCFAFTEEFYQDSKYYLRFQVPNSSKVVGRIKLGHCPVLSSDNVSLELVEKCSSSDSVEMCSVVISGSFDGPDESICGLVHLVSLKLVTLRPVLGTIDSEGTSSFRVRVEILKNAFDECESLLEVSRQLWKKSMMNVMAWLRPEVLTSEARYGMSESVKKEVDLYPAMEDESSGPKKRARFDVAGFYEAIKPSKKSPMLEDEIPDLQPVLRPYQRRAANWMVQREKGNSGSLDKIEWSQFLSPLCIPVGFLDTNSKMYYNPFSGNMSLRPEPASAHICGGILADEMGLGKTVELLACVFAHLKPESEDGSVNDNVVQANEDDISLKRLKRERVECICGAVSESRKYKGLWVQCDVCDAWQHADCVGYSPRGKSHKASKTSDEQSSPVNSHKRTRKNDSPNIVVREGDYICQPCSELLQAINSPINSAATLIVCPAPILSQWHSEIIRHTRPGSLKTYIYEGVRSSSLSNTAGAAITELVNADIVLTTYDVLKEDLSHDSDRHEGDRRFLRHEKRYPVIPTLLTRVYWWRVCLDEAQMVESNTAAATEMALRLYAKHRWCITGTPIQRKLDDLYGLLRFLKASPFNVSRWWVEVIRDPYERKDEGAMEFTQKLFKQIMWRSSKVHVADDLQLPPQEECLSCLTFSPIEEHFYQRQHETCVSYAREITESLKKDIMKREVSGGNSSDCSFNPLITDLEAEKLLSSLLKLRQACCHPQVGSFGLRSLQQAPMSMEEILKVLISKTKIEGEDALRKLVSSLNGLAGIAIIQQDLPQAVSLYKEALDTTKEQSEDFRLDPLLNIHIHHNLAEILVEIANATKPPHSGMKRLSESIQSDEQHNKTTAKRQKMSGEEEPDSPDETGNQPYCLSEVLDNGLNGEQECNDQRNVPLKPFDAVSLRETCENLKQKYLTTFTAKLSAAQQEFRKSRMQVHSAFSEIKNQQRVWWLEALHHAEQNKDFAAELIRKIEESISSSQKNQHSSRMTSRFRSITGLKYHIQTGLDLLEDSRKKLIDRIEEIDQMMENPSEEDISRVRYCRTCQVVGDGPMCVHCELDELFQDYEARLFRVNKSDGEIKSAEEAVDLRKKNSALNRFYWNLSGPNKNLTPSDVDNEDLKRDVGEKVIVSKSPSVVEVALGVIKGFCKAQLGREGISAATKQILILESMRKEYRHARQLSIAQAQVLQAHDEIKMATTRLRLKEDENDNSIDALSSDELASASVENSSEKFMASTLLSNIKGKLRYLKGLALSKNKLQTSSDESSITEQLVSMSISTEQRDTCSVKVNEEACPICHDKLSTQKMVFQCGHITCCKCLFAMTEQRLLQDNKSQNKWVMCPVCRQHTDVGNIAYVDDRDTKLCNSALPPTNKGVESDESLTVEGSYGTKIEAVTRRVLWIKSTDAEAKVLVFSSWNDVLDVLEHAFAANSISFIRMKGGRKSHVAITEFRGQSVKGSEKTHKNHVQVLLLLIQHGANGLNLLEAQHVILVEPLLNPAVEAQAISRVHRIGQDKRTLVHRFIVKNTVEESIYKLNRSRNSESFISWNTKNQDQPVLTLKDIESLFAVAPPPLTEEKNDEKATEGSSLRHLPPSEAAAIAAEKRLQASITG